MIALEISIPNGYVVMNDDLRAYVRSGEVPTLGGAEWYDRKVIFYFDYVSNIFYYYFMSLYTKNLIKNCKVI